MSEMNWSAVMQQANTLEQQKRPPTQPTEPQEENLGVSDYLADGALGIAAGTEGFFKSIGKLTDDITEVFGGDLADDSVFDNKLKTKTWLGGLTSGVTQFAWGFVPAAGVAGWAGKAAGITSTAGKLGLAAGAGAVADFVSFKEDEERLSNLIESVPALRNPVTEYLAAKPEDSWAEGRFKNVLEGMGLGALTDVAFRAVRGFKGKAVAKAANDPVAYTKASEDAAKDVEDILTENGITLDTPVSDLVSKTYSKSEKLNIQNIKDPKELTNAIITRALDSGVELEDALRETTRTWVNLDRLSTSEEAKDLLVTLSDAADNFVQKRTGGVVSLDKVKIAAQELGDALGIGPEMVKALQQDASNVKNIGIRLVVYREVRNSLGEEIGNLARKASDDLENTPLVNRLADLSKLYAEFHTNLQVIQTEGARIPSFGRVTAGSPRLDYSRMYEVVRSTLAGSDGAASRKALVNALVAAGDDPKALQGIYDGLAKHGRNFLSVHNELWINAILSGVRTQATNLMNGVMQSFLLPAERIAGGVWMQDTTVAKSGTRLMGSAMRQMLDIVNLSGISERMADNSSTIGVVARSFMNERPVLEAGVNAKTTRAFGAENFGLQDHPFGAAIEWLGKAFNMPTRLMMTADQGLQMINYRAYLWEEGFRLAEQAGIKDPAAFNKHIEDHIQKGFDSKGRAASGKGLQYAQEATFSTALREGTIGASIQNMVGQHPMLRLFLPFIKTPTNIFRRFVQYTPGVNFLQEEFREMWNSPDKMRQASARGRMALGGVFWGIMGTMSVSGKLTGGGPQNPEERSMLMSTGWRPYSVVLDNGDGTKSYLDYRRVDPFGMILGMAADLAEASGQLADEDLDGVAQAMGMALARNLTNKTYLTGLREVVNALSQPDQYMQRFLENRMASYVPSIVGGMNDDEYMRETRTMLDAVRRKLPGLSDSLPPRRNLLGEPTPTPSGWLPFGAAGPGVARMVSPVAFSKSVTDPVKQELAKLQFGFSLPQRKYRGFDLTQYMDNGGRDAYDFLQERVGKVSIGGRTLAQSLDRLISSQRYKSMPEPEGDNDQLNPRIKEVQRVLSEYRQRAMKDTLKAFPRIKADVRAFETSQRPRTVSPVIQTLLSR